MHQAKVEDIFLDLCLNAYEVSLSQTTTQSDNNMIFLISTLFSNKPSHFKQCYVCLVGWLCLTSHRQRGH